MGTWTRDYKRLSDEAQEKFGLDAYRLERHSIYKERDTVQGDAYYTFTMEWFPKELKESIEEDYNPEGTAIVEYAIQKQQFSSVSFVQGESFSTKTHFPSKTADEVATWLEKETGSGIQTGFQTNASECKWVSI